MTLWSHRWNRKLRSQESPRRPIQLRRHPLLGYVSKTSTPRHHHGPIRWTDLRLFWGKSFHPRLHWPPYRLPRWRPSSSSTHLHLIMSSSAALHSTFLALLFPHLIWPWSSPPHLATSSPFMATNALHANATCQPTPTASHPANQSYWTTTRLWDRLIWWRSRP